MRLKEFRELTRELPDNTVIVIPSYLDCYTESDCWISQDIENMSIDGTHHNAYQHINLPEEERYPTIVMYPKVDYERS